MGPGDHDNVQDYNGDGDDQSKGCHDGTWDAVEDCEPVCAPPCQVTIL